MNKCETECLLSIIIPVYNVRDYLDACLDSVFKQETFGEDIEVLLVDDGSTDGSGALCDQYEKQCGSVRVFHKENGGLSDARNYGGARAALTWCFWTATTFGNRGISGKFGRSWRRSRMWT